MGSESDSVDLTPVADCRTCRFRTSLLLAGRCVPGDACVAVDSGRQIDRFFRANPELASHYINDNFWGIALGLIEGLLPDPAIPEDAPKQLASAIQSLRAQQQKTPSIYPDLKIAIKARERGMFPLGHAAATALVERGVLEQGSGVSWSTDPRLLAPSMLKLSREYLQAFVNQIHAPIKLLLADGGLPTLYANYLQEVEQFAHVDYEVLSGGHHLHMEQEVDLVAKKLNSFFSRFTL